MLPESNYKSDSGRGSHVSHLKFDGKRYRDNCGILLAQCGVDTI